MGGGPRTDAIRTESLSWSPLVALLLAASGAAAGCGREGTAEGAAHPDTGAAVADAECRAWPEAVTTPGAWLAWLHDAGRLGRCATALGADPAPGEGDVLRLESWLRDVCRRTAEHRAVTERCDATADLEALVPPDVPAAWGGFGLGLPRLLSTAAGTLHLAFDFQKEWLFAARSGTAPWRMVGPVPADLDPATVSDVGGVPHGLDRAGGTLVTVETGTTAVRRLAGVPAGRLLASFAGEASAGVVVTTPQRETAFVRWRAATDGHTAAAPEVRTWSGSCLPALGMTSGDGAALDAVCLEAREATIVTTRDAAPAVARLSFKAGTAGGASPGRCVSGARRWLVVGPDDVATADGSDRWRIVPAPPPGHVATPSLQGAPADLEVACEGDRLWVAWIDGADVRVARCDPTGCAASARLSPLSGLTVSDLALGGTADEAVLLAFTGDLVVVARWDAAADAPRWADVRRRGGSRIPAWRVGTTWVAQIAPSGRGARAPAAGQPGNRQPGRARPARAARAWAVDDVRTIRAVARTAPTRPPPVRHARA